MLMTVDSAVRLFTELSSVVNEEMRERGTFERVCHYRLCYSWTSYERGLPSVFLEGRTIPGIGKLVELSVFADVEAGTSDLAVEFDPLLAVTRYGVDRFSYLDVARQVVEMYDSAIENKARRMDDIAGEIDSLTHDDETS